MILNAGLELLSAAVGVGFPVYKTFLLLELPTKTKRFIPVPFQSKDLEQEKYEKEKRQLLIYWSVYGCITAIERSFSSVLRWIPFLTPIKIVLWIWLLHPKTLGAEYIYEEYLKPFLTQYKTPIHKFLGAVGSKLSDDSLITKGWNIIRAFLSKLPAAEEVTDKSSDSKKD
ncbi:HVA22/TB2/DP1 family protein [Schizosaccharomyces japonicus yFS275]|uniref:Protein YOP1 n=1 Tax=Schizosaccharomyces japonicus (strain yFS275 / FY16936) TaxID=402676 RepID=B6K385_SCHJY|nr:HVA22/TB2/DP1 family protein [Schizosaccharomyces japonicus yFS275]EEB07942.1 HVA22/TB2/DP1 family protein [Schizosaccharomyces japonicus yFS275]